MSEDKKVSEFTPRRGKKEEAAPLVDQPTALGSGIGDFDREQCGECWHFKRDPRLGLNVGRCMLAPPVAQQVQLQGGQMGNLLSRPVMPATYEGCDQFDDELPPLEDDANIPELVETQATGTGG
jgi:hypothetical protein